MTALTARLLYALAALVGRLPWPVLRRLGDALAWLGVRAGTRESEVTLRNLELAYPELLPGQREEWRRDVLRSTALQTLETLRLWTRPHAENLALIGEIHGEALFDDALAAGRGLIVAAPHFGNWELLNQWLAAKTPLAILYKPPESAVGEAFLRLVRADADADRITQVRAEGAGVRQLYKRLQGGGVVGILPDQQPKGGDGEFAPFFGVQALTMTLLGRLAGRSGATVLFAWCERLGPGAYALRIEAASPGIDSADPLVATTALNADVERIARRDPAQYQWTYKRYKARPPGSGESHPYADLERR
ncbi:MAG TPA: lauroyl acyltransferase [Luteimonas sp.]|nr:lauroyl acyltransferase [Luteimonas sp.]HRO26646.1 lauroyl acyltransferase [Luteimonas sp.]HRP72903.1 lauroyl acyltransferase [Luteimonas sp.]